MYLNSISDKSHIFLKNIANDLSYINSAKVSSV